MVRIALAAFHLIALGLGLGAVIARGSHLREPPTAASLSRAFRSDTLWGIAAGLWILTGLWRLFGAYEKPQAYYFANSFFHAKMGFLVLILVLEIWPMTTLIRWRIALKSGIAPELIATPKKTLRIMIISHTQALLIVLMIFAAVSMARGYGMLG
jgi:putative membrane protein